MKLKLARLVVGDVELAKRQYLHTMATLSIHSLLLLFLLLLLLLLLLLPATTPPKAKDTIFKSASTTATTITAETTTTASKAKGFKEKNWEILKLY